MIGIKERLAKLDLIQASWDCLSPLESVLYQTFIFLTHSESAVNG